MPAILFGSISTLADTSEIQRAAFNEAFAEHGLDWSWDVAEYQQMLRGNGGAQRVRDYAAEAGVEVDADAIHKTKSEIFQRTLAERPPAPRAGVVDTVAAAREAGWQVGLVTTTSPENIAALLAALSAQAPELSRESFDVVVDRSDVSDPKPDPEAYRVALESLGRAPGECVAIEDNVGGVQSAVAAGVTCVAYPNQNTMGHDFGDVHHVAEADLTFAELADQLATD